MKHTLCAILRKFFRKRSHQIAPIHLHLIDEHGERLYVRGCTGYRGMVVMR